MEEGSRKPEGERTDGGAQPRGGPRPVWSYRGYELLPRDFATAMAHLFRAEVSRANVWRQRLDTTTNWAVITTGAAISLAFTETLIGHLVIILNTLLVTLFLFIEARRYRYYELWSYRVRLMETDFFATMLVPPFHPAHDWAETLAENLLHPDFPISMWEAVGRRLRRNYIWIYLVLGAAWLLKIWLHPEMISSFSEFLSRSSIGPVPGWLTLGLGLLFYGLVLVVALLTVRLREATGEVLPRFGEAAKAHVHAQDEPTARAPAWFRPSRRRQQYLALIITDRPQQVADLILKDMHRGATALEGRGMYTREKHSVLMCALTTTEVPQLKSLVHKEDPKAFVIISPAYEVLGRGFLPLEINED